MENLIEEFDLHIPNVGENEYRVYYKIQFSLRTDKRFFKGILKTSKL